MRSRLLDWLSSYRDVARTALDAEAHGFQGVDAARQLFRVTMGLDSALVGESEIIAQVRQALRLSVSVHAASPLLKAAFRDALEAAEHARTHIWRRFRKADIGSVAVDALETNIGTLQGKDVVVLGAGSSSRLATRALYHAGARTTILNRTLERAVPLATRYDCAVGELSSLRSRVHSADAIVVGTSAPAPILVPETLSSRSPRPLTVVDMSWPHNADPTIASLHQVTLFDLGYLQSMMTRIQEERACGIPAAGAVMEERVASLVRRIGERNERKGSGGRRMEVA